RRRATRQPSSTVAIWYLRNPATILRGMLLPRKPTKLSVRPATISAHRHRSNSLTADEFRLYELIWKRTVASQMVDATGYTATVKIVGTSAEDTPRVAEFSASGTVITVPGFMKAYESDQKSVPNE